MIEQEFEYVEQLLGNKRYLLGDHFTAADLTFACMVSIVLLVQPDEGICHKALRV